MRYRNPNFLQSTTSLVALSLTALLPLALTGCGRSNDTPPAPPPTTPGPAPQASTSPTTGGDFKVAAVLSGPQSDNGWNAGGAKALAAVKKALNLPEDDVKLVDSQTSAADQEKSLSDFAAKKFNIVFGHGTEYEEMALKMEDKFPDTLFVISSGSKVGKHTMPVVLHLEDGAYLEGMLAAAMSKTGKLGEVGAEKSAPLEHVFAAFERGAKAVKPGITVVPAVYTGSWDDANKAKQSTLALLNGGADVIMQDVDSAAQGVFNAVQEFAKKGKPVYALGTNSDQNSAAPDVILASAPIYTEKAWVLIAQQAKAGTLTPNDTPFGMKEGVIDFVLNPQLESKIPADIKQKLDETKKKIADGSLDVTKG